MSVKGSFVWFEYMGDDVDAAAHFYRDVVGWAIADSGMVDYVYKMASAGEHPVGGLMNIPEDAKALGARACWSGYVWVEDVDAALIPLKAAGGSLKKGPIDIPGIGRFAVVADPQGAIFMLFRDAGGNPPPPPDLNMPGWVGWRELHAEDGGLALTFYTGQFGWKRTSDFDMGPMGTYHLFESAPGQGGGMMTKMPQAPGPFWLYYFNAEAIDAAVERIKAAGGQIANGPMEVPTGQWVVQAIDPQGALFALVAPKR